MSKSDHDGCVPGDITVRPIHEGYILGRVVRHEHAGPWWEYIKIVRDRAAAITEARRLALAGRSRLWFHEGGDLSRVVRLSLDLTDDSDASGGS